MIVEIRAGAGGDEAALFAGDLYRMLPATPSGAASRPRSSRSRSEAGGFKEIIFESAATAPTRCSSSRAAPTASSASRRPSPRAASTPRRRPSRCCPRPRTSTSRSTRTTCRSTSTAPGPRRAVGQHDRLGRADHPPAHGHRRLDAGREVPAAEPRARDAGAARPAVRARAGRAAGRDRRQRLAQVGTGQRAEKIRTYNYGEQRVKDHRINLLVHNLDDMLEGELDELTDALQDDEKRRRLESAAGG